MLDLNDALRKGGVDPASRAEPILVARHSSPFPATMAALRLSASGDRSLLETYQRTQHNPTREAQVRRSTYLVSCIAYRSDTAVFVGLYRIGAARPLSSAEYRAQPHMARLLAFDAAATADVREGILLFELEPLPAFESLRDRLEIGFPSQRAWLRSAATSRFPIVAIHPEFVLAPLLPRWDAIILSTAEIEALPPSWRAAISQWRGIYCTPGPPSTRPASPGSKPQAA